MLIAGLSLSCLLVSFISGINSFFGLISRTFFVFSSLILGTSSYIANSDLDIPKAPAGDKYLVAQRWGHIHIVSRKWIDQSILRRGNSCRSSSLFSFICPESRQVCAKVFSSLPVTSYIMVPTDLIIHVFLLC